MSVVAYILTVLAVIVALVTVLLLGVLWVWLHTYAQYRRTTRHLDAIQTH